VSCENSGCHVEPAITKLGIRADVEREGINRAVAVLDSPCPMNSSNATSRQSWPSTT
jgi:hypothetical protein